MQTTIDRARLVFILAALTAASGCYAESGDTNAGRFTLTWTISTGTGEEIDCLAADADTVVVKTTVVGSASKTEFFPCGDMGGTTDPLTLGRYRVEVSLGKQLGGAIEPRGTEVVSLSNLMLLEGDVDVSIGNVEFIAAASAAAGVGEGAR